MGGGGSGVAGSSRNSNDHHCASAAAAAATHVPGRVSSVSRIPAKATIVTSVAMT